MKPALNALYVQKYFNKSEAINEMIKNLINTFKIMIEENDWINNSKNSIIEKVCFKNTYLIL